MKTFEFSVSLGVVTSCAFGQTPSLTVFCSEGSVLTSALKEFSTKLLNVLKRFSLLTIQCVVLEALRGEVGWGLGD